MKEVTAATPMRRADCIRVCHHARRAAGEFAASASDPDTIRSCSLLRYDSDGDAARRRRQEAIPLPLAIRLSVVCRSKGYAG
ncbi:hypothetical protein C8R45DRAFT_1111733 [Mycena sanguinolenta]|nr:hypothetical protein C8R45DRAFT_1111733 [Mycena sanguinolenta]